MDSTDKRYLVAVDDCACIIGRFVPGLAKRVLVWEAGDSQALDKIRAQIARTLDSDRCEAIVLGCGGMSDLTSALSKAFGVPVIDGVSCAVKTLEGLAGMGLKTSKRGGYASPRPKRYAGMFEAFSRERGAEP